MLIPTLTDFARFFALDVSLC